MAEFVMKDMLRHAGIEDVDVESAALHTDEIGGDIHPGTKRKLRQEGIPFGHRAAWLLTAAKARRYDMIIGMDAHNRRDLQRLLPADEQHKIHGLLDWSPNPRDIADPWYTGDFDETYRDVVEGCGELLKLLGGK